MHVFLNKKTLNKIKKNVKNVKNVARIKKRKKRFFYIYGTDSLFDLSSVHGLL